MIQIEKNNTRLYQAVFFSYSISLMELLLCQPFHVETRFIIYLTVLCLGLITILKTQNQHLVINTASILFLSTEAWTAILLFVHKEFMIYGLAAMINILLFIIGLKQITSDDLLKEALTVTRILTYTTLFIVIISLSIAPIMNHFQKLKDLTILGKPFVFSDITTYGDYRLRGFAHHPNQTGMICSTAIIASFFTFLFSYRRVDILLSAINIILNSVFLVLASSRSPIVATVAFVFAFLFYYFMCNGFKLNHAGKRLRIIIIAGFLCLAVIVLISFNDSIREYIIYKIIRVQDIETATGRTELQKIALNEFLTNHHFFTGLSKVYILDATANFGPHNTFIELLVSKGAISLILFIPGLISLLIYSVKILIKRNQLSEAEKILMPFAFGMIFATIVQNSFESAYLYSLTGAAPFERWSLCIPVIIWCNQREKKSI